MKHIYAVLIPSMLFLICATSIKATSTTIVKVDPLSTSANLGETFTVSVVIENVQNLYGLEVDLRWNTSVLKVINVDVRLGVESHPDGVLHEDFFNLTESKDGEYFIAATSYGLAPPFYGSGTIFRITFNVTKAGSSKLDLETQLYDYPPPNRDPRISFPIDHTTMDGFFDAIPEFSNLILLILFMSFMLFVTLFKRDFRKKRSYNI